MKKVFVKIYTFTLALASLLISFGFLSYYSHFSTAKLDNFLIALSFHLIFLLGCFSGIEYSYKLGLFEDRQKFKSSFNPLNVESVVGFYCNPSKSKIIGALGRYSLLLSQASIVVGTIIVIMMKNMGYKPLGAYAFKPTAIIGVFFLLTFSFLRILVRCPNCKLDIYFQDSHMYAYHNVAKRALKDNVLECWHCHAAFALDPNMNLDKLREENIKNWKERDEIIGNLNHQKRINQKFM